MEIQEQIDKFHEFFDLTYKSKLHDIVEKGESSLVIEFSDLAKYDPELAELLLMEPEETLKMSEVALEQFDIAEKKNVKIRIRALPESQAIKIRDIRSKHLDKIVAFDGIVRQTSDVRPQVISARFECPTCGNHLTIAQTEQTFKEPSRCSCGRRGKFKVVHRELVDTQRLIVEEASEALEGGEQSKRIAVFLREDLVEPKMEKKTTPGAKVRVNGVIKEIPIQAKSGGQSTRYDIMAETNFIEPIDETYEDIVITPEDEEKIKAFAADPEIYNKLGRSISPSVFGHEDIKNALVLQLMGGVRKERPDGTTTKGDIHMLLVGDPGAAKSTILMYMAKAAPKARYIAGRSTTSAGITASVVKDEFLRGWALEAGAIVLANGGFLLLDEMDKMTKEDTSALHEALAQQSYHPDTELMFADGSVRKIGNFVDALLDSNREKVASVGDCEVLGVNNIEVLTTDFKEIFPIKVNRVSRHKAPKHFVEIEYSNGRSIRVTPEHPLFVYGENGIEEVAAIHVRPGMTAPAPQSIQTQKKSQLLAPVIALQGRKQIATPAYIDKDMARFLGYLVSEGHTYYLPRTHYAEIGISNTDSVINDEVRLLFERVFNSSPQTNIRYAYTNAKAKKDLTTTRLPSLRAYNFIKGNFEGIAKKAVYKQTGNIIRTMEGSLQCEFLKTAFRGDGIVDANHLGYSTGSYGLAKDYQDILLQQGIWSYIHTFQAKGKTYFKVYVAGTRSLERFSECILEKSDARYEKAMNVVTNSKKKANSRENVPKYIVRELNNALKELGLSDGYFIRHIKDNHNSHRKTVLRYLNGLKDRLEMVDDVLKNGNAREIRRTARVSVADLAKRMKVSASTVYNLERRKSEHYSKIMKDAARKKIEDLRKKVESIGDYLAGEITTVRVKNVRVIKNCDIPWAYDVTVEPTKTFISEGLVLHNTVTISKANIQATLRARTTLLAAANPKFGRFDPYQPIASQIDLPPALINRFDLIFPVRDLPNKEKDTKIASHILDVQRDPQLAEPEVSTSFIKKYVAYVRQKVHPKLTAGAIDEMKSFYVELRNSGSGTEEGVRPIPISARQLEALIRLAEASARVRLSDKVIRGDAKRAINILKYCLMQVGFDYETGQLDIDRISTGIPASARNKIIVIREIITEMEAQGKKTIPIEDIISEAAEKKLTEAEVEEVIDRLKREGEIFEPRRGWISKI